ncbi:MAG: DUF4097 family beta strand repeat-containing protein [Erysipelotrichaceae bacterium]
MTQEEYMKQVEQALGNTDEATRNEILEDFTQHFTIGLKQGKSVEEIIASLGDVSQFEDLDDLPKAKAAVKTEESIKNKTDGDTQRTIMVDAGYADVDVTPSKDNQHHVYLIKDGVVTENSYLLEKREENGALSLRMTNPNRFFHVFDRDLEIQLEVATCAQDLKILTASGDVELSGLTLDALSIVTASGDIQAAKASAKNLRFHSASGDLVLKSIAGNLHFDTASGDAEIDGHSGESFTMKSASGDLNYRGSAKEVYLHSASSDGVLNLTQVERLTIETVSGDYRIRLAAQGCGVKLDFKGISGECEFDLLDKKGRIEGRQGKTILGDGKISIDLRSVSGDFSIED